MQLTIALVAHDRTKPALADWVLRHKATLAPHRIIATATTGRVIRESCPDIELETVKSGPLGGDQQIGAMIAEQRIDALVFFPDPLTPMPHDVDVKALLRLALVYDVPCAFNLRTADMLIESGLIQSGERRSDRA
jgi:methylglyoxal synthase